MITIAILQSSYIPWIGYFEQIYKSDLFIVLDNVQFTKNNWRNRNRIKSSSLCIEVDKDAKQISNNWHWLTVPVHYKYGQLIKDVTIDNSKNWVKKHKKTIVQNYNKAPFFNEVWKEIEFIFNLNWTYLNKLNYTLITYIKNLLGINTRVLLSSRTDLNFSKDPNIRLIEMIKYFNADVFYEGKSGSNYINEELFKLNNIKIQFQNFNIEYPQLGLEFEKNLSILDLLFNCGFEKSLQYIRGKQ